MTSDRARFTDSAASSFADSGGPCAPNIIYASHGSFTELIGDGDANIEPGEKWSVPVALTNNGTLGATDSTSCPAINYELLYGSLSNVATPALDGAACTVGTGGSFDWTTVPAGSLFILMAGTDGASVESSWGKQSSGAERGGANDSGYCGIVNKDTSRSCP